MSRDAGAAPSRPAWSARAPRMVAVLGLVIAAAIVARALSLPYALERELWLARASGWSAAGALLLALTMTPLARAGKRLAPDRLPRALLPALRRAFGIAAACFALVHAATTTLGYLDRDWRSIPDQPYLRAGLVALAILVPLLVTSFPRLTRGLGVRLWKPLHRLAYVAALLVLQHLLLSPFAPRQVVLGIFATAAALGLLRLLPARRRATA